MNLGILANNPRPAIPVRQAVEIKRSRFKAMRCPIVFRKALKINDSQANATHRAERITDSGIDRNVVSNAGTMAGDLATLTPSRNPRAGRAAGRFILCEASDFATLHGGGRWIARCGAVIVFRVSGKPQTF
jgi:hypothetical protein